jgi:hypothetical protein
MSSALATGAFKIGPQGGWKAFPYPVGAGGLCNLGGLKRPYWRTTGQRNPMRRVGDPFASADWRTRAPMGKGYAPPGAVSIVRQGTLV